MNMKRTALTAFMLLTLTALPVHAEELLPKPDDHVSFNLAAEDWVTTKTARVMVGVEAAVGDSNAGSMREDMMKAVNDLAKTDWRLVSFNRSLDQTGLERWSAMFESRLPENELSGLAERAKKAGKAGLQLSVGGIDFSPTLDEMEAARATLRAKIYKQANEQLTALNATLPGRTYRISGIDFSGEAGGPPPMPFVARGKMMPMMASAAVSSEAAGPAERSEKITLSAEVTLATAPVPAAGTGK
jgi:hypothetical protein